MHALAKRLRSSINCWKLTGYLAGRLVPDEATYHFNSTARRLRGKHVLSMVMNIIVDDEYRLARFGNLSIVVDVGANVGVFANHVATKFPEIELHCYEPDPRAYKDLLFNTRGINASTYSEAVSECSAVIQFACEPQTVSSRILHKTFQSDSQDLIQVASRNLSEVICRLRTRNPGRLIKLDCEGAEYQIIEQSDISFFDHIVGELHKTDDRKPKDAANRLMALGYSILEFREFEDGKAVIIASKLNHEVNNRNCHF